MTRVVGDVDPYKYGFNSKRNIEKTDMGIFHIGF